MGLGRYHSTRTKKKKMERDKNMRRRQSTLQMLVSKPIDDDLRYLYWAAEYGDTHAVQGLLAQQPPIDADLADAFGRTAIQIAVVNENAEVGQI